MASGNNLPENQCWQEVQGAGQARMFPFLRKIDTNSSNSYILALPGATILIDPGGMKEQMDLLATEIDSLTAINPAPVFVFLTHAHVDHFLVILTHPFFKSRDRPVILAAHGKSAALLSSADGKYTQAELFGRILEPIDIPLRFFRENAAPGSNAGKDGPLHAGEVSLTDADIVVDENMVIRRQIFCSGPDERVEIFETPGHSPDSLCYRIGDVMFVGDLLFAANPGIAGSRGWNQKDLIASIGKVLWLLDNEQISICCPGHGRIIPRENARTMLLAMKNAAGHLGDIAEVTPEWAQETAGYAESLMDRVAGCFTVMAGRCYRAAHILEDLEESGEAERISGILNIHVIDEILDEFHRFNEDYRKGNQRDVQLALKAGQVASKLEQVYKKERLDLVIDPYLVRRVARLLSDYSITLRGLNKPAAKESFNPDTTLRLFINQFTEPNISNDDLMALADNEEEYMLAFVRRLVRVPLFGEDPVIVLPSETSCMACADVERLNDLVASILEDLAGADYSGITVGVRQDDDHAIISIRARKMGKERDTPPGERAFMKKECEIAGGSLTSSSEGSQLCVTITLPLAR